MAGGQQQKKKLSKNAKRRLREQKKKEERRLLLQRAKEVTEQSGAKDGSSAGAQQQQLVPADVTNTVEVEYVGADLKSQLEDDEALQVFSKVFDHFAKPEELTGSGDTDKENTEGKDAAGALEGGEDGNKVANVSKGGNGGGGGAGGGQVVKKLSKKKRKLANRLKVAQLKQLVKRPDVVEVHDVTAADPRLLVYLKSYRNTVPVPRHWSLKRKYLQGKRGVEKPPFELPECIKLTGIDKIREAFQEKESAMNSKAKARANLTGATGKIEIDYQVLYNAFFKFKTKPKNLTTHGDLYYESKEFETRLKDKATPGQLSVELREALGMPTRSTSGSAHSDENGEGADGAKAKAAVAADLYPPPWLINMQRYGPPPDYPKLKIPGLNAPIPAGASFGYNPGQWGKPPVDEFGQPLYGNVFDVDNEETADGGVDTTTRWGELVEDEDESEEEESDESTEDESDDEDDLAAGIATPDMTSGISSVTSGLTTPSTIDLRKGRSDGDQSGHQTPQQPQQLYQVIGEAQTKVGSDALFGSSHRYVIPGSGGAAAGAGAAASTGVSVALDPSDLEDGLSQDVLQKQYDAAEGPSSKATLDAINAATKKRKLPQTDASAPGKKKAYKSDFKF